MKTVLFPTERLERRLRVILSVSLGLAYGMVIAMAAFATFFDSDSMKVFSTIYMVIIFVFAGVGLTALGELLSR